jgi:NRAMP (natural resistance-associated macrophage protein)-like metal ion transporter
VLDPPPMTTERMTAGASREPSRKEARKVGRTLGLGLVTGACDDDPSAIGTYASAGAAIGPSFLWTAPVTFPMMFAVVYLSSKLGQVTGKGLFHVIRDRYPRWILWPALIGVLIGNVIEAGADLGGMAAAIAIFVPVPVWLLVIPVALAILALQVFGSYELIRDVFRWLSLALLAYVGAAILAKPDLGAVLAGTFIPQIRFDAAFLSLLVAVIGTTLSAYLYTWQSNVEVEEEIARGHVTLAQRRGASDAQLRHSRSDILAGMFFSNLIMYFIILATASTLYEAGQHEVASAADAARALQPIAGDAAGILFALGIIGVGFLAVPIMTTGAAYDLSQVLGWKHSLHARPQQAKKFYAAIAVFTLLAMSLNFLGFNPIKALVWSGIVQGFSTPPLLLLIMLMTNDRKLMGRQTNSLTINILGWATTGAIFAATAGLVVTWFL